MREINHAEEKKTCMIGYYIVDHPEKYDIKYIEYIQYKLTILLERFEIEFEETIQALEEQQRVATMMFDDLKETDILELNMSKNLFEYNYYLHDNFGIIINDIKRLQQKIDKHRIANDNLKVLIRELDGIIAYKNEILYDEKSYY